MASEKKKKNVKTQQLSFCKKRKLWFEPNKNPVLLEILKFPPFTTVCSLNHWSTDQMTAFMDQCWWGDFIKKATKCTCLSCPTCLKYNQGKPVSTAPGHLELPNGPFEVWQMHFIPLPPSHGYKYVLVMVCMFSHWTEAFICREATVSSVAKVLLEKFSLHEDTPLRLLSDQGTHFTVQERSCI